MAITQAKIGLVDEKRAMIIPDYWLVAVDVHRLHRHARLDFLQAFHDQPVAAVQAFGDQPAVAHRAFGGHVAPLHLIIVADHHGRGLAAESRAMPFCGTRIASLRSPSGSLART